MRPPVRDQARRTGTRNGTQARRCFSKRKSWTKNQPDQRLLYGLDPVDYLADLAHGAVGPLQLFPTSIVQRLAL
jgi:hypothetical protein